MRIGLFTDAYLPDINGVVSSVATLKGALEEQGHTVFVISNHKGANLSFEDNILRLGGLELKKFYGYKMSSPIQIRAEKYIRQMELDVIHVHTEAGVGMFGRQMAKLLHIPLVYTYHTMYEDYTHYLNPLDLETFEQVGRKAIRRFSSYLGNGAQAVIAPSEKTKQALIQYGVKTPIYIVPTGLDLSFFDKNKLDELQIAEVRSSLGLTAEDHVIVFVGRIAKEKSIDIPIRAIKQTQDPNLKLVIVGGGTDEAYYKNIAKEEGVNDRVLFTGRQPKEKIPYYYAAFDGFVSASTTETQGMTYIEALATGLCVFGRRDKVLENLIDEDKSGYYFDDEYELAKKWDQFFSKTDEDRKAMVQNCLQKVAPYSTRLFAMKALSVYNQAIDDYSACYNVIKLKVQEDFVKLTLQRQSDAEPIVVKIPIDDYFDLKIQVGTDIDAYVVEDYLTMQYYYDAYSQAKKKVLQKDMTQVQLKRYCTNKLDLTQDEAGFIVEALAEHHLLDDRQYAIDKAQIWANYGYGKNKIKNKLFEAGIDQEYVNEACQSLKEEDELNAAIKSAKRISLILKEQSNRLKRQTIIQRLISKGYSVDVAKQAGDSVELDEDEEQALALCVKKAKRKYSSLPADKQLKKIRIYCMQKGFSILQIDEELERERK